MNSETKRMIRYCTAYTKRHHCDVVTAWVETLKRFGYYARAEQIAA